MQQVDFTTLTAACAELQAGWIPGRLEKVYQRDRYTIALCLRTLQGRGWLTLAWHPQAARICLADPPPRLPDTFTFSDQLRHQLNGLALVGIQFIAPWERVLDLQFARRPGDPILWHLYVEIMGPPPPPPPAIECPSDSNRSALRTSASIVGGFTQFK